MPTDMRDDMLRDAIETCRDALDQCGDFEAEGILSRASHHPHARRQPKHSAERYSTRYQVSHEMFQTLSLRITMWSVEWPFPDENLESFTPLTILLFFERSFHSKTYEPLPTALQSTNTSPLLLFVFHALNEHPRMRVNFVLRSNPNLSRQRPGISIPVRNPSKLAYLSVESSGKMNILLTTSSSWQAAIILSQRD